MSEINDISIPTQGIQNIPDININSSGGGIRFIQQIGDNIRLNRALEKPIVIDDTRIWMQDPPEATPVDVPVTTKIGTPIVDMPGCVKVHKENKKGNRNKQLVNDDPKGNTVLCDGGMPYYEPPEYDARELTWMTVYGEPEEEPEGINTETGDIAAPETPEPPPTDEGYKDPECPGPTQPRLGSVGPNEKEKVTGYELRPDPNNLNKKICVVLYEDIGIVEQYLPSPQVAATTATIATVAGASALLAKPLADLLLRVFRPAIKQALTKVNAILGRNPYRLTDSEKKTNEYRLKKGLNPIPFAKNHQKKVKAEKKKEQEKKK